MPLEDEGAIETLMAELAAAPRQAILWTQSAIPTSGGDCTSYFGGLPRLPPNLEWPRLVVKNPIDGSRCEGSPTFIGQLDFADIAAVAPTERLPDKGVLYFFCDTCFVDGGTEYRVLFAPEGCADYPERAPPADLMRLTGGAFASERDWRSDDEPWSRVDFRRALTPRRFTSYQDWSGSMDRQRRIAYDRLQIAALEEVFGPLAREALSESTIDWPDTRGFASVMFPSWPQTPLFYREFRRGLEYELNGGDGYGYKAPTEANGAMSLAFHNTLLADLARWEGELSGLEDFAPVPSGKRDAIRQWFIGMRKRALDLTYGTGSATEKAHVPSFSEISRVRDETMWLTANIATLADALVGLDRETVRAALRARIKRWSAPVFAFDPARPIEFRDLGAPMHQTLGFGELCQSAAEDHVDDILLLQLGGGHLGWQGRFYEMLLQFWISSEDLAERRFDRVVMTEECT
jgi:hypothetical protein